MDLKEESGFNRKTEFSSFVVQDPSGLSHLLTKSQADLLKTLSSSALKTDSEFFLFFIHILYHLR